MNKCVQLVLLAMCLLVPTIATAAPIMYVHDERGNLARVDVQTGSVDMIGNMGVVMTDIAFDPTGLLYGISFTTLYAIDAATAGITAIGSHGISSGNALVFGSDGTLYGAGNTTTNLCTLDLATGAGASIGNMGFTSGGDLAFHAGNLYLASGSSHLVNVDPADPTLSAAVGAFGVSDVFGLATGDDGNLYGVAGTQIFLVNTATGAATNAVNYGGQGLFGAYGQAFYTEAGAEQAPEPATIILLGMGAAIAARRRRRN